MIQLQISITSCPSGLSEPKEMWSTPQKAEQKGKMEHSWKTKLKIVTEKSGGVL